MFDPDKPKLQDKGKGTAQHFEKAYWQVMAQVEAPAESINALLPLMYDSFEAGLPPAQMRYLMQYLPDGQWRWPEYERQMLQNADEQTEEDDEEPDIPSNRELLEELVNRIFIMAYGFGRHQRMAEANKKTFPYLSLWIVDESKARPECLALKDKVLRWDNPCWENNLPPCKKRNCQCHVTQMTELMVKQKGLKVVDN